ncbi:MAG TPA: xanthine dehydrogenase family protein molybdopterin-binding subunit [Acidimicrobiia bacterium]|nr:xanthine dehydrogenase family protein molybdopterin-binding subunit [Acidimicrobiia bacterium]
MQQQLRGSIRGAEVRRVEDPRFIKGLGNYLDDMHVEEAVWAVFIRSTVPHGIITAIDTAGGADMPGVVAIVTASDLEYGPMPHVVGGLGDETRRPLLATDRVRFVGEPVAVVLAESQREAFDAAQMVWVDYELLPAVATPQAALADDAPPLFPEIGTNVVLEDAEVDDDVHGAAAVVVSVDMENQRVAPVPLETNNALAIPRSNGEIDIWVGSQNVHAARNTISRALGIDRDLLHVRTPDMGGGFGAKINVYREQALVVALALRLGRPIRWQEGRGEGLLSMTHGRAQHQHVEVGARRDGTITGLRWEIIQDAGAYPLEGASMAELTQRMASGPYAVPAIDFRWKGVLTNTTPTDAYRGAGRPEATMAIERVMDVLAAELEIDPAELRRRNFIPPEAFPYVTATGERYDSGDYAAALDLALSMAGYDEVRTEQARRRTTGDRYQLGIGLSSYVEVTAPGGRKDWGRTEVTADEVVVYSGALSHGHGHETTFAQIAADALGVAFSRVRFVQGDTDFVVRGGGTMGSRSLQMSGSAILRSSQAVWEKARRIVAHHREAALEDVVQFDDGRLGVAGVPDSAMTLFQVATLAEDPANLPPDEEPGLSAEDRWAQEEATVPFGTHVSVVEVDTETGDVRVLRHVACDDCGTIFSPMIVDGQVHGGVAQGLGQALWESFRYDDDANPLTANLTSYLLPTATIVPSIEIDHTETTTDQNPLGAKGIGEAGTIGSAPAVVNAVHDALRPFGVRHLDMPLTPWRIWQALHGRSPAS